MSRLLLLTLVALLAGCGQKGPLYLPSSPPAAAPLPSATVPAVPASDDEADKKPTPAAAPAATAE